MLFLQFWINSTRDVWKFCQIGLTLVALILLIPNCTHNHMINYANFQNRQNSYI